MTTLFKYRLKCNTENKYKYVWSETEPNKCPDNTSHTIDTNNIAIINKILDKSVTIKEELIPTGGNFCTTTVNINAIKNTTTSKIISFPIPINILAINFTTEVTHTNDNISVIISENTNIGTITSDITAKSAWVSQNYIVNDEVRWDENADGKYKNYKCILNTVSNENPSNTTYWEEQIFSINVSNDVINDSKIGYDIRLNDETNTDKLGRITKINGNTLDLEFSPINSYLLSSPTNVELSICMVRQYELGPAQTHSIGHSKIGGSYIPANAQITVKYNNKSTDTDKSLISNIEYLY